VKVSVSLCASDVQILDTYAQGRGLKSRSAAVHDAVRLLQQSELAGAYEDAWVEWTASDDAELWDGMSADSCG
jgi:Arc/MetJ-type ribon-helix-helix transcriptional regulator